ncbi:putative metal-dependent hydrolase [Flammeovirga pectinis]|uniref:Putative metal-dependent hydrolase n=1 Tax=Flammeovirga pectinis TaxID=2494373 RepID=A0A3Q9FNL0_9BACT|nr:putative metal-dependent hydrolase [Flammeovirga pectinis]AZQ61275.1 putative metal-dependent hydrolase [Flammeovirga pectinis]
MEKLVLTEQELKFPIGEFQLPSNISDNQLQLWIHEIKIFPQRLIKAVNGLTEQELNYKYRPNGWTIKQVVHHCADSHMNSYMRFKLALTEDTPAIRPYFEDRWAELHDSNDEDVSDSLNLLTYLHKKWISLLEGLSPEDLNKAFFHPESEQQTSLKENIGIYAWHGCHHIAHIKKAIEYKGQF